MKNMKETEYPTKQPVPSVELLPVTTQEDIGEVAALAKRIWHEHYDSILGSEQVDYMTEKFQSPKAMKEQIESEGYRYYKLVNQGGLAGYYAFRTAPDGLFLSKIYIVAECRGRGYSRRVMELLEDLCRVQRLPRIWLTVNRNNSSSIAVYESLGFTKVRTQIADIGSGYVMDDYIMEKKHNKIIN